jgi:hypothetical protein
MLPRAELRQVLGLLALIPVPEQDQMVKILSKNTQKFLKTCTNICNIFCLPEPGSDSALSSLLTDSDPDFGDYFNRKKKKTKFSF